MHLNINWNERLNPILERASAQLPELPSRIAKIALPFLSLHPTTNRLTLVGIGLCEIHEKYTNLQARTDGESLSPALFQLACPVSSTSLLLFFPQGYMALSNCYEFGTHLLSLIRSKKEGKPLQGPILELLKMSLYQFALYRLEKTGGAAALPLVRQAAIELQRARKEDYLEAFFSSTLALIRLYMAIPGLKAIHSHYLEKNPIESIELTPSLLAQAEQTRAELEPALNAQSAPLKSELSKSDVSLKDLDFTEENLVNLNIKNIKFKNCKFRKANLNKIKIQDSLFENCHFSKAEFNQIEIHKSSFIDCSFEKGQFNQSSIKDSSFIECDFSNARFKGVSIAHSLFRYCTFLSASFSKSDFFRTRIFKSNFNYSHWNQSHLDRPAAYASMFFQSNWSHTTISLSDLSLSCLNGSHLDQVTIHTSTLSETNFLDAQVTNSKILDSDLTDCLLCNTKSAFLIEGGSPHHMTRPVVAFNWQFHDSSLIFSPLIDKAIQANELIILRFQRDSRACNLAQLKQEIQLGIESASSSLESLPKQILSHPFSEVNKIVEKAASIMEYADGLAVPGGLDIEPEFYRDQRESLTNCYRTPHNSIFHFALIAIAEYSKKPVIGICRGAQMINIYLGGTLRQHVGDHSGAQPVHLVPSFLKEHFGRFAPKGSFFSHSAHHQAIDRLGKNLKLILEHQGIPKLVGSEDGLFLASQIHPEVAYELEETELEVRLRFRGRTLDFHHFSSAPNKLIYEIFSKNVYLAWENLKKLKASS